LAVTLTWCFVAWAETSPAPSAVPLGVKDGGLPPLTVENGHLLIAIAQPIPRPPLKNSIGKVLYWKATVDGRECKPDADEVTLAEGGQVILRCQATLDDLRDLFLYGLIKRGVGLLDLRLSSSRADLGLLTCVSCAEYTGTVMISYWSTRWQVVINTLVLLAVLLIGGLISHVVSLRIPNRSMGLRLGARLQRLKFVLPGSLSREDQELWSSLTSQRERLQEYIKRQALLDKETATLFEGLQPPISLLTRRTNLAARVERLRQQWLGERNTQFRAQSFREATRGALRVLRAQEPETVELDGAEDTIQTLEKLNLPDLASDGMPKTNLTRLDKAFLEWVKEERTRLKDKVATMRKKALGEPIDRVLAEFGRRENENLLPLMFMSAEENILKVDLLDRAVASSPIISDQIRKLLQNIAESSGDNLRKAKAQVAALEVLGSVEPNFDDLNVQIRAPRELSPNEMTEMAVVLSPDKYQALADQLKFTWCFNCGTIQLFTCVGSRVHFFLPAGDCTNWSVQLKVMSDAFPKLDKSDKASFQVRAPKRIWLRRVKWLEWTRMGAVQVMAAVIAATKLGEDFAKLDIFTGVLAALAAGYLGDSIQSFAAGSKAKLDGAREALESGKSSNPSNNMN